VVECASLIFFGSNRDSMNGLNLVVLSPVSRRDRFGLAAARSSDGGTTGSTAAIQNTATGNITTYRKLNKPAYGPIGDSLDDFTVALGVIVCNITNVSTWTVLDRRRCNNCANGDNPNLVDLYG
jgi:hypothetical protein